MDLLLLRRGNLYKRPSVGPATYKHILSVLCVRTGAVTHYCTRSAAQAAMMKVCVYKLMTAVSLPTYAATGVLSTKPHQSLPTELPKTKLPVLLDSSVMEFGWGDPCVVATLG
eukprot:5945451-Amphidinium_carterae.1